MLPTVINIHNDTNADSLKLTSCNCCYNNKRQYIGLLFLLITLISIIYGCWRMINYIKQTYNLPLSQLIITGKRCYTTNDDIRQIILSSISPKMGINQNINIIQQQIKQISWIKQVYIHRQWPNKLNIHLIEYIPEAWWNDLYLLDNIGDIFNIPLERIINYKLPKLYGPENTEKDVLNGYYLIKQVLISQPIQIKSVIMSDRHSWQLILNNNICLKLGRENLIQRLQRYIKIYPILLQQSRIYNNCIHYVDLRYENGLAVGWCKPILG